MSKISRSYQMGIECYRNEKGQFQSPNNDTPARVSANRVGAPLHEFYQDGELHRDQDKPAFIGTVGSDNRPLLVAGWFQRGQAHREGDKPSAYEHNVNDGILTVTYSKRGVLDRDPKLGPASFQVRLDRVNDPIIMSALFFQNGTQVQVDHPKLKIVYRDDVQFSVPIDVQIDDQSFAGFAKRITLPEIKQTEKIIEEERSVVFIDAKGVDLEEAKKVFEEEKTAEQNLKLEDLSPGKPDFVAQEKKKGGGRPKGSPNKPK